MKALFLALIFLPQIAFADVSIPRSKQYAYTLFDVSQIGGAVGAHASGLTLPAGAIITNVWLYINTQFASSGTESLGVSCGGSQNIMAYTGIKNTAADRLLAASISGSLFTGAAAPLPASPTVDNLSQGFASVPSDCSLAFDVLTTGYTAGKATLILEYFRL